MLADPTTIGVSQYTHAGHALVYLSGVCAETPVEARLCRPGEQGTVVTTYPNFKEDKAYGWNLVPMSLYLRGTEDPGSTILYAATAVKVAYEAHARERYFKAVCAGGHCPEEPHSYWRNLVATTVDRDVFVYAVHTTQAQDAAVVEWLNRDVNENHYNGLTHNCANFVSALVNSIFPHAVHRDPLNDLGMMGPKAAARSFTHWALRRPELGFYSMHFAQMPGDLPRTGVACSGTETGIHMKKYLLPAAAIGDHEVAGSFFVAYFFTGRFGLYKEYERHPTREGVGLETAEKQAKTMGDAERMGTLKDAMKEQRDGVLGDAAEWTEYRRRFAEIRASGEAADAAIERKRVFPKTYRDGAIDVDAAGGAWMTLAVDGAWKRVGISSGTMLAEGSDPMLAFQIMLGRVQYALKQKGHMRETILEFRADWTLLEETQRRLRGMTVELARQ